MGRSWEAYRTLGRTSRTERLTAKGATVKMHRYALILSLLGTLAITATSPAASKQRIAIDGKGSVLTPQATFVLTTLSRGGLTADVGHGLNEGAPRPIVVAKTGQSVRKVAFTNAFRGKNGTFDVVGLVESASAGNGFAADHGTWTFKGLTGTYAGYSGGGAVALVSTPTGRLVYRLEGYVSKR